MKMMMTDLDVHAVMPKILVLCTGNSCRSIMAEAIINAYTNFKAKSAGTKPKNRVHPYAKKVLKEKGIWKESYYSKDISEVIKEEFELVITVCNSAKESCPVFPKKIKTLHIPFEDPDGKDYSFFIKIFEEIKTILLPKITEYLKN